MVKLTHLARPFRLVAAAAIVALTASSGALGEERAVELDINGKIALADLVIPDGQSLADGVVVLTHGTLAHKDMELIASLQTMLAERGVATLAHSLTFGQDKREGMYDCAVPHSHTNEDAMTEIAAWTGWLKSQGAIKISHLGHSRGGNQVARYAAATPGSHKVVLMAPATGSTPESVASSFKERFKQDLAPLLDGALALKSEDKGGEMMQVPGFIYCPAGKASADSVASYYGVDASTHTAAVLPNISAPVLIIAGSADTVVPEVEKVLGPLADGEKVQLEVIADADHMFLEFYAEDAADLIAEFVGK